MIEDEEIGSFIKDGTHVPKRVVIKFNSYKIKGNIKFPCVLWACIKTLEKKIAQCERRLPLTQGVAQFNQEVIFETYVPYNIQLEQFAKKNISIVILLESKRAPGSQKMVGRLNIDLASICNNQAFKVPTETKLEYCSLVGTTYQFSFDLLEIKNQQESQIKQPTHLNQYQKVLKSSPKETAKPQKAEPKIITHKILPEIKIIEQRPSQEDDSQFQRQSPKFNSNRQSHVQTPPIQKEQVSKNNKYFEEKPEQTPRQENYVATAAKQQITSTANHNKESAKQTEQVSKIIKEGNQNKKNKEEQIPIKKIEEPFILKDTNSNIENSKVQTENDKQKYSSSSSASQPQLMQKVRLAILCLIIVALCVAYLLMKGKTK